MTITQTTINRIKRVASEIACNALSTSPGPWYMSHGHVISPGKKLPPLPGERFSRSAAFDVASQPWDKKHHTIEGLNAYDTGRNDMRHIATCEPSRMAKLCADIDELLAERESVVELAVQLDQLINNTMGGDEDPRAKALGDAVEAYLSSAP